MTAQQGTDLTIGTRSRWECHIYGNTGPPPLTNTSLKSASEGKRRPKREQIQPPSETLMLRSRKLFLAILAVSHLLKFSPVPLTRSAESPSVFVSLSCCLLQSHGHGDRADLQPRRGLPRRPDLLPEHAPSPSILRRQLAAPETASGSRSFWSQILSLLRVQGNCLIMRSRFFIWRCL